MDLKKNALIIGINLGDFGSTGEIMRSSLEYAHENEVFDYLVIVPYSKGKPNTFAFFENSDKFIDKLDRHYFHRSINNPDGFYEKRATLRIVDKIKEKCGEYDNVIVNLHNIHMAHIDLRVLFKYLAKEERINKVFYTLHDCWSFTGGCYYYSYVNCNSWLDGCKCKCCQNYDAKHFSVSKNYNLKKKYTCLFPTDKLKIFTVSNWLKEEAQKSFLSKYEIIDNYGETSFVPVVIQNSNLKEEMGLKDKKIVLSISAYWNDWKGYKYLYDVADQLPKDYILLVIGGSFDTKGHKNIIHIGKVPNEELVKYYSMADVYISTSQCETLGLTTCEAQLCGTPVVCFGHTAIKETLTSESGIIVGEKNNIRKMVEAIKYVVEKKPFAKENIIKSGNRFAKYSSAKRYFELYKKVL